MAQHVQYRDPSDTNAAPSPAIWAEFDEAPVGAWAHYFDDFLGPFDPTTACGTVLTTVNSGTIKLLSPTSTITGLGILNVSSNGHNAQHDGVSSVQLGSSAVQEVWCPIAGHPLLFEARVMLNDESDEFFIGLCDTETAIIDTSGDLDYASRNMIGFSTDANTTASYIEFTSANAGSADQQTDCTGIASVSTETAFVDNTWIKLGFMAYVPAGKGALRVVPYVNGKAYTAITDTDDIPTTIGTGDMAVSFAAQVAATGANAELYVDWVRVAQKR